MSRNEHEHTINGVQGRMFGARTWKESGRPELATFATQTWKASREYKENGRRMRMVVELRFDDNCRNGHDTFGATCDIQEYERGLFRDSGGGAAHDEIARVFPELADLLKWHLVSTDGPMHYISNVVYLAGDRDHNGLRKGETKPRRTNKGSPMWELVADTPDGTMLRTPDKYAGQREALPLYALDTLATGDSHPATPTLRWQPLMVAGEGKERDLKGARSVAVWPQAPDAVLMQEPAQLRASLESRLPQLLADFRAAMESAGFEWSAS